MEGQAGAPRLLNQVRICDFTGVAVLNDFEGGRLEGLSGHQLRVAEDLA
jgi:hypothetical protein